MAFDTLYFISRLYWSLSSYHAARVFTPTSINTRLKTQCAAGPARRIAIHVAMGIGTKIDNAKRFKSSQSLFDQGFMLTAFIAGAAAVAKSQSLFDQGFMLTSMGRRWRGSGSRNPFLIRASC